MAGTREQARRYYEAGRAKRLERKKLAVTAAGNRNGGCVDCGWVPQDEAEWGALEFDHRDPDQKHRNVCTLLQRQDDVALLEEAAKCDVRCTRCHRIMSIRRGELGRKTNEQRALQGGIRKPSGKIVPFS